uniref:Copia protein n=1 Tax=Lygus hesperus TaxID=30085 RepID=A0A0K8SA46_LYGHE
MATARSNFPIREKLKGSSNFQYWYGLTSAYFRAYDLFDVAIGKKKKPEHLSAEEKADWVKKDCLVQRIISTNIDTKLLVHLMSCKSGKEMYDKLKMLYGRDEKETDDLMEKFFKLSYTTKAGMVEFFRKLERTVSRLKYKDIDISDTVVINRVLSALPPCYEDFIKEWEATKPSEKILLNLKTQLISNDTWNKYTESDEPERRVNPDGTAAFACLVCDNPYHHGNYCLKNYVNRKSKAHFVNGVLVYGKPDYFDSADAKAKEIEPVIAHPRCTICKKDNHGVKNCFFRPKRPSRRNEFSDGVFSLFFDDYDQSFRVTVSRSYPSL